MTSIMTSLILMPIVCVFIVMLGITLFYAAYNSTVYSTGFFKQFFHIIKVYFTGWKNCLMTILMIFIIWLASLSIICITAIIRVEYHKAHPCSQCIYEKQTIQYIDDAGLPQFKEKLKWVGCDSF